MALCASFALAAALSACGGDPAAGGASSTSPATTAQEPTTSVPSATTTTDDGRTKVGDTVDGAHLASVMVAAMTKAGTGRLRLQVGTAAATQVRFRLKGQALEAAVRTPASGATQDVVLLGGVIYVKGVKGSPKPWLRLDPKGKDQLSQSYAQLTQRADPRTPARTVQEHIVTVVRVTPTRTEYEAVVPPEESFGTATATPKPQVARYVVDRANRLVRISITGGKQPITITYSGWGEKLTISAPPAALTAPLPKQ